MDNNENDKLLDHEYDGIQELDNNLPLWWLWTFFGAIIFAFIYWIHFSLSLDGLNSDQELARDMAQIAQMREKAKASPESGNKMSAEETIQLGKQLYNVNCSACHKTDGGGSIGANLTDSSWIHGGEPSDVQNVIENGVLDKGMPPWKEVLRPNEVQAVVAFVETLRNTNVPDGKAAQGNKVDE